MAVQPDTDRNFIHGLADFWSTFFADTKFTEEFFQAGQLALGQVYLELLQEVLGTSLEHAPLFSKDYYRLFLIREDQLRFEEGASTDEDRWVFTPEERVTQADTLMNKVIAPTSFLLGNADYDVKNGAFRFKRSPFTAESFPIRTVRVAAPALLTSVPATDWSSAGVRSGDELQYLLQSAPAVVSTIRYARGNALVLADGHEDFLARLQSRTATLRVLRAPYDGGKAHVRLVGKALTNTTVSSLSLIAGTTDVLCASVVADWTGRYLYLDSVYAGEDAGFYRVNAVDLFAGTATLERATVFATSSNVPTAILTEYDSSVTAGTPTTLLPHTYLTPGTFAVQGARAFVRLVDGVVYPEGKDVLEGVDYLVDYATGQLTFLVPWVPQLDTFASYQWKLFVAEETYVARQDWTAVDTYNLRDVVIYDDQWWVCVEATATVGLFLLNEWAPFSLFALNEQVDVLELAAWAPDVLVDRERLYTNFGYLLGYQQVTSEQYRAFLKGVSHLFLLGPSIERMRSALNVAAGLPVVRSDGERFKRYVSGYTRLGSLGLDALTGSLEVGDNGALFDFGEGVDGVIDATAGTFYSPTAGFFQADDVGAVLRITYESSVDEYTVTAINSTGDTATLAPPPSADLSPVRWRYRHNVANGVFRVDSSAVEYLFSENDVDRVLTISAVQGEAWVSGTSYGVGHVVRYENTPYRCVTANSDLVFDPLNWAALGAVPARNVGSFRIIGVDGPRLLRLESQYGFTDAHGLRWQLSPEQVQQVETDANTYVLPITVPVRPDIVAGEVATFRAYEALTDAIRVVDYVSDPTWWHRVSIPSQLLELDVENIARRQVSSELIPNVFDPLDEAVFGDFGVNFDSDENENPGYARSGPALWLGADWVQLLFPASSLTAGVSDIGQSVVFSSGPFAGAYPIVALGPGNSIQLGRFPPISARGLVPTYPIANAELPPLVYRRSVAFVLMDRFLKYHALRVEIDMLPGIPANFLSDATGIIGSGKPGYTYLFADSATTLRDVVRVAEEFTPDIGHPWLDDVAIVDNRLMLDGSVLFNEYYRYLDGSEVGVNAVNGGLVTFTVTPVFPYVPDRYVFVYAKFTQGTLGGSLLALGRDYTFDELTGLVTVPAMDAGPYTFSYVVVSLKAHDPPPSPWWTGVHPGETPVCFDGAGPTIKRAAGGTVETEGVLERAVQITIA